MALARGLVQDPPILLMDEPFAALDEQTRLTMGDEVLRIWERTRKTIIFVTHGLSEAIHLSDQVLVLTSRPGKLVDRVAVDLPRPRSFEVMGGRRFEEAPRAHLAKDPGMSTASHALPSPRLVRMAIVLGVLLIWEILPRAGIVPSLFLPPMTTTLRMLVVEAPIYARHMLVTLQEVGVAMIFACGGGVLCGLAIGGAASARQIMLPMFSGLFAVPLVVLYPLFTAWFGIGSESKIIFASVYGFLPTLLGTAAGVQTVDRQFLVVARSLGATRMQKLWHVYLPATLPTVLAAFRLGGALAIVGVVVAEMLTSTAGIGFLISKYRTLLDSPRVYAAVLLVLVLAIAFDGLVQVLERRLGVAQQQSGRSLAKRSETPAVA
ncbi:ABC transporter permease subunit [Jiella pelagia]|uniref:ABC transporter permease subunit n=1 Tax=Jiella pelagia TaxID=2986949 RepID=A0ABY7C6D8_9HYPH|nr:ABC transporter permease subunit [Jiella pelagia]